MINPIYIPISIEQCAGILDDISQGWYLSINLDKLDFSHIYNTLLGQVFGEYCHGIDRISNYFSDYPEVPRQIDEYYSNEIFGYNTNKEDWINLIKLRKEIVLDSGPSAFF